MTASPHMAATVTTATSLWNPSTKRWVFNGSNQIRVGTKLEVRTAQYKFDGVSCYPVTEGTWSKLYAGYFVPVKNVRLQALVGSLLDAWLAFSRSNIALQQFGQSDDESTFNGATGCTHTILQRLIKAKTGAAPSHDVISQIAGYPWPSGNPGMRGLFSGNSGTSEVERVIARYALPYKVVFGWSWAGIVSASSMGPVMIGVRYGYWPEWRGYSYHGTLADGKPNGYAARHGKTQLTGFETGFHAALYLGNVGSVSYGNEPNHGSTARPEKPDYDVLTIDQGRRAYDAYSSSGRSPLAWVPTRAFRPKGY
jgi:hypothetical protein